MDYASLADCIAMEVIEQTIAMCDVCPDPFMSNREPNLTSCRATGVSGNPYSMIFNTDQGMFCVGVVINEIANKEVPTDWEQVVFKD